MEEPDCITPSQSPTLEEGEPVNTSSSPRQHRTSVSSKRLSGRRVVNASTVSLRSAASLDSLGSFSNYEKTTASGGSILPHHDSDTVNRLISQVSNWLQHEKQRRANRKLKKDMSHSKVASATEMGKSLVDKVHSGTSYHHRRHHHRRSSEISDDTLALQSLEQILDRAIKFKDDEASPPEERKRSLCSRKGSIKKLLRKHSTVQSSETEYQDIEFRVPSAEVVLDNTKTLKYARGASSSTTSIKDQGKRAMREKEAWIDFKNEIVRLAHTLKLKDWRRVPLDQGANIDVERLSGALTNAVYVVSPPKDLPEAVAGRVDSTASLPSKKPPR